MLGKTDACWNAVIPQLEPEVYYVKLDDDIVYIQVRISYHTAGTGGIEFRPGTPCVTFLLFSANMSICC